jgi:hypothetical protein
MFEALSLDTAQNPVIVFDDHSSDGSEEAPIQLRFPQPSFTYLGFAPTPKGFRSLSDFRANRRANKSVRSFSAAAHVGGCSAEFQANQTETPAGCG